MTAQTTSFSDFRDSLQHLAGKAVAADLSDEERIKRVKETFMRKLDGRKAVDLDTCLQCGMCAEACHFYEATQDEKFAPVYKFRPLRRFYRRELSPMRWLFRPFTRDISMADLEEWQTLVYDGCTSCGRCDMMCPMGVNISTLIRIMREGLAAAGYMPAELRAMQQEQQEKNTVFGIGSEQLIAQVENLREQGIEVPLNRDKADIMLLTTATDVLLFPDALAAIARILNKVGADWTLSSDAFEATNTGLVSGDDPTLKTAIERVHDKAKALGVSTLLLSESGHAYQAMRWEGANEMGHSLPFEVLSIPEFVAAEIAADRLKLSTESNGASVTYHDPCRLARKGGVMQQPRDVLSALGLDVRETEANRRENHCCGGGCGEYVVSRSATMRQKAFDIKRREFDEAGADAVVTACTNCRVNFMLGAEHSGWETPVTSFVETVAARLAD